MESQRKRLSTLGDVHLYCVTTPPPIAGRHVQLDDGKVDPMTRVSSSLEKHYRSQVEAACAGGADMIQLREKTLSTRRLIELCRDLKALCDRTGALFIVNDRVDVALAADADGVHLGQDDLPVRWAREMLGHRKVIGCSAHSILQASQAESAGADYVSCGPVFATPTKPDYEPVGLDLVRQYKSVIRRPFVAIGGIDETNVESVIRAGAERVAVVRAAFDAPDISVAVHSLRKKVLQAKRSALPIGK